MKKRQKKTGESAPRRIRVLYPLPRAHIRNHQLERDKIIVLCTKWREF